jgi:chemotaxis protein methyltransferase CheR
VTPVDFAFVAALCRTYAGMKPQGTKGYLVETRLSPVARREGFASTSDLLAAVRERRDERLIWQVVEAMAAGQTFFFRDRTPFARFREELVPSLAKERPGQPIRVWSAACATGQEIYSLAMIADQLEAEDPTVRLELAASDLSTLSLERAKSGRYDQFEIQRGLPIRLLIRYFEKEDDHWRLVQPLRDKVRWRRINLIAGIRQVGRFDIVFCRYALSGMTEEAQRKVLGDLACVLPDHGYLILGPEETLPQAYGAFEPVADGAGVFRRNPDFRAEAA